MEHNKIIIDWLTFTTFIHDPLGVIDMLGMSECPFISLPRGMNGYPYCLHFNGVSVCYGGRDNGIRSGELADMGVCVCMSGQGCRAYESFGYGDWSMLFTEIINNYSDDPEKRDMNISRIDIAYDDFNGLLDINTIKDYVSFDNYVARSSKWSVTYGSEGTTIGIGSQKSDTYIRIYDKKAEQHRDDIDHWVRCEIQLRAQNALGFICLGNDYPKNFFDVLNNYLRFVEPSESDTNKRRWAIAPWWEKFLQSFETASVFMKPGVDYNFGKLDNVVFNQFSGAVATMIDLIGLEKFCLRMLETRRVKNLNPKYKDLKAVHGTSSDTIQSFLSERGAL